MPHQRAGMLDARSEGHKGDQVQVVSVRVRIRNEVGGSRSSVRADGGTVARMSELVSCFSGLNDRVPLSSCILEVCKSGVAVLFEPLWT